MEMDQNEYKLDLQPSQHNQSNEQVNLSQLLYE